MLNTNFAVNRPQLLAISLLLAALAPTRMAWGNPLGMLLAQNNATAESADPALQALEDLASGVPIDEIIVSSEPEKAAPPKPAYELVPGLGQMMPASTTSTQASTTTAAEFPAAAPVQMKLAQIHMYGLKQVAENDILAMLQAKEGSPYTRKMQSADLTRLLESKLFTSVSMRRVPLREGAFRLDIKVREGVPHKAPPTPPVPTPTPSNVERVLGAAEPAIPPGPWVIGEFDIKGNKNVKFNVIRNQVQARKGDLYERSELSRDVEAVNALGGFERVVADIEVLRDREVPLHFREASPSPHPIKLTFLVEERALVHKIKFVGRKKLSKGRLRDEMELKERDPLDRVQLRQDLEAVLESYRKKGYLRATAETSVVVDSSTLKATITYSIVEGTRSQIKETRLHGVEAFTAKKVLRKAKVKSKPGWLRKVFQKKLFDEDKRKIETFYKNRGYQDFEITSSSVTFSADQRDIFIDITIKEGREFRFGDTTFAGYLVYSSTELKKVVDYKRGKIFDQERFDYTIHTMQELYAEKGRLRTQVTPRRTFNEETGLLDVHFDIIEGSIVYVDHVDIEGNKATKTYVFKREIVVKPGEPFSISKIRKSQNRIRNLGFIDEVGLDVQSPYDPSLVDLTFEVFEGKPGMLTAGAGFSSLDGVVGTLSLQHLNLLGRAYRTSVSWSFGSRVNDFTLGWTNPWIYEKPISFGLDAFNTRRISPFQGSSNGFTSRRTGGAVRLGPRFHDDKYQMQFTYTFQQIKVSDIQNQFLGTLTPGTSVNSVLGWEITRDTRDNIWDPTEGTRHSTGFNFSGGPLQGDIHFFKPFISNAAHKTLTRIGDYPLVLSFSNRTGYVTPFGDTKVVPVFERFFIGGQDSLRGYSSSGEVGTRNGGKVFNIFNTELGFPLARERRRTIVKFVTFFDAGAAWDNMRSVQLRVGTGEQHIKTNVGFGIRFTTPAFPIRLDWGYGFQHRPGEDKTQINFGIGSLF
jgi:outer membrane protein insertion porin family